MRIHSQTSHLVSLALLNEFRPVSQEKPEWHTTPVRKCLRLHNTFVSGGFFRSRGSFRDRDRGNLEEAGISRNSFVKCVWGRLWWLARVATSSQGCNKSKAGSLSGSHHWSHTRTRWIIYGSVLERTQMSIPESLFIEHLVIYCAAHVHPKCWAGLILFSISVI